MKLIVGLGNPGSKYNGSRHNVGFDVVDHIAKQIAPSEPARSKFDSIYVETQHDGEKLLLMKPQTFMNRSGQAVTQALTFYKADPVESLLVIVDDIHLPCGSIRLRTDGSAGGHNGLHDITNHIGDGNWSRLRIGIDEPGDIPQASYVLGRFTTEQQEQMVPAIEAAVASTLTWLREGASEAMNKHNQKRETAQPNEEI
ncbi:MAG: aminoacyl-tRNA hydrolase [Phycisphaerales bacterium]|jgi:PTH1 family peptidyl-tRNA hydrolase|nr:aminoacyl-tRNA hydrolase [Phycisphaerales bacterium]